MDGVGGKINPSVSEEKDMSKKQGRNNDHNDDNDNSKNKNKTKKNDKNDNNDNNDGSNEDENEEEIEHDLNYIKKDRIVHNGEWKPYNDPDTGAVFW